MISKKKNNLRIVYSTENGKMCPYCSKPVDKCTCRNNSLSLKGNGIVRIGRETKGRRGKPVTIITGLPLDHIEIKKLAKQLKEKCGAGGTVKNGVVEIQGDHRQKLSEELKKRGWTVKYSGA